MDSISVIIPTYNSGLDLTEAVESALAQTYAPVEIIVIDDGSTDDTEEICARFPAPVRYLKQPKTGVAAARNRAVREAKGTWIAYQDADDIAEPTRLETQMAVLKTFPHVRWCFGNGSVMDPDGRTIPGTSLRSLVPVFKEMGLAEEEFFALDLQAHTVEAAGKRHSVFTGDMFRLLFLGSVVFPSATVIARDFMLEVGPFDEQFRVASDTEFFHRAAAKAPVAFIATPLFRCRRGHGTNLTGARDSTRLILTGLESQRRAAALRPLTDAEAETVRVGRQRIYERLAYAHLTVYRPREARDAMRRAYAEGAPRSAHNLFVSAAACLPAPLLRLAHLLKRLPG